VTRQAFAAATSAAASASLRDSSAAECESARFAAYLAHEVRTPLATQRALLELALADPHADATSWREIGVEVLDACKQQERLLDACVALARSQSGLARYTRLDLGSIVSDLLADRDLGGLTVRSTLESAPITGDPALIERLVDNLVANAVRHNRPGGWVEVTTRQSGTTAWFAVENTGPAIPARELTRLFEPFHQVADQETRDATGGLGLGLAVAKAVADAHDALVTAHARLGGGLRVEVAFPPADGCAAMQVRYRRDG
jgi:signal transduction histidine kinase